MQHFLYIARHTLLVSSCTVPSGGGRTGFRCSGIRHNLTSLMAPEHALKCLQYLRTFGLAIFAMRGCTLSSASTSCRMRLALAIKDWVSSSMRTAHWLCAGAGGGRYGTLCTHGPH
jgi:hypothetical protein